MREVYLSSCQETKRGFVWEVHRQAMKEHVAAIWGWDEALQKEKFDKGFSPWSLRIIVVDGVDAGFLEVVDQRSHFVVGKIELLPQFQRQGIGTFLLTGLLRKAEMRQVPVRLQVLRSNTPARRLYERLGFIVTKETKTHFQMEKSFAPIPALPAQPAKTRTCGFCGREQGQVGRLVSGPGVFICDVCVRDVERMLAEEVAATPDPSRCGLCHGRPPEVRDLEVASSGYAYCGECRVCLPWLSCSFCSQEHREVKKLVRGPNIYICDTCVGLCLDVLAEESSR
jgi:GNAT superfamily N-acetyltransferase